MKSKISDKILKEVRSTSKKIIKEEFPQEMEFFDVIWSIMKENISTYDEIDLEDWQIKEYQSRIMSGLGFTDPGQQPDLTAPIIIAVLAAVFWHIGTLMIEPTNENIERMIEDYSDKFRAAEEVKEKLKNFLPSSRLTSLVKKEIIAIRKEGIKENGYDVYINGKYKSMSKDEVEKLELNKKEYLVWVWAEKDKTEILIDKKEADISQDTNDFRFLCSILKRIGKELTHSVIESEVTDKYIHQHLNKFKEKTGHVLDKYIIGTRWRFKIKPFKACLIVKKSKN